MGKLRRLRCVCAPQSLSPGTSIGPKASDSVLAAGTPDDDDDEDEEDASHRAPVPREAAGAHLALAAPLRTQPRACAANVSAIATDAHAVGMAADDADVHAALILVKADAFMVDAAVLFMCQ